MQGDYDADSIEQLTPEQQVTDARSYGTAEEECTGQPQAATEETDMALQQVGFSQTYSCLMCSEREQQASLL